MMESFPRPCHGHFLVVRFQTDRSLPPGDGIRGGSDRLVQQNMQARSHCPERVRFVRKRIRADDDRLGTGALKDIPEQRNMGD